MTPETWRQIEDLYHAALEHEAGERSAFLAKACAGNEPMRSKVEKLLKAHVEAGRFLDEPALETAAKATAGQLAGSLERQQISHYEILSVLGSGGMGAVYLARDARLERMAALKILPEDLGANPDRLQRFIREAKTASALNHSNVATIYDVGEADGVHFIAMEYVDGQTLASKLSAGPLDCGEIVDIGIQVADALDAAHARGITHRDIKPANIMVTPRGQVKVLDFGLAKVTPALEQVLNSSTVAAGQTVPGVVMGTVQYMSPEQVLGREVDHRTDIFSLGVVLYEMATGRPPFAAVTGTETMDRILHARPDAIERIDRELPAELERVTRKCLEKDRDRRYQSAGELFVDLRNLKRDSGSDAIIERTIPGRRKLNRPLAFGSLMVVIVLVAAAIQWLVPRGGPAGQPIDSIAVLPFANASGDRDTEYLSDGIAESLINNLSQLPKLRVIARTTAFTYKGKEVDPHQIYYDLNARAVLTGRLIQRGDTLTIQVDLIDGAAGTQLWGERYTRKLADIFAVQEDVARQISDKLRLQLSRDEQQLLTKHYTEKTEAYQLYIKARHDSEKLTREGTDKAIAGFHQAIEIDPQYALAYASLAEAYLIASDLFIPSMEAGVKAKEAALRALALDDNLSEAHAALGAVASQYDWDWSTAEREFKRAIQLNPASAPARHNYGTYVLCITGRFDEGLVELRKAQQLDPLSPLIATDVGTSLYWARRYDEAIGELKKALDLDPNYILAHSNLASAYLQKSRYPEAFDEYQKAISAGFYDGPGWLGYAFAVAGRTAEARKLLQEFGRQKTTTFGLAVLHIGLGQKDEAIAMLEKLRDQHFIIIPSIKVDPAFDSLRGDPRFTILLRSMGLEP